MIWFVKYGNKKCLRSKTQKLPPITFFCDCKRILRNIDEEREGRGTDWEWHRLRGDQSGTDWGREGTWIESLSMRGVEIERGTGWETEREDHNIVLQEVGYIYSVNGKITSNHTRREIFLFISPHITRDFLLLHASLLITLSSSTRYYFIYLPLSHESWYW